MFEQQRRELCERLRLHRVRVGVDHQHREPERQVERPAVEVELVGELADMDTYSRLLEAGHIML